MRSFHQDRLGTNIGKTQKKTDIFLTGPNSHGYNTQLMPIICAKANATGYFLPADWPVVAAR